MFRPKLILIHFAYSDVSYHWFCLLHPLEINAKILGRLQIGPSAPRMHKVPKLFENPESSLCFKKTARSGGVCVLHDFATSASWSIMNISSSP